MPEYRGMPVTHQHLKKYGYSEKCSKCRDLQYGTRTNSKKGHTKQCRARVIELALKDPEFRDQALAGEKRKGNVKDEEEEGAKVSAGSEHRGEESHERKRRKDDSQDGTEKAERPDGNVDEEKQQEKEFREWIENQSATPRGGAAQDANEPNCRHAAPAPRERPADVEIPLPTVDEEEEPEEPSPKRHRLAAVSVSRLLEEDVKSFEKILQDSQDHSLSYVAEASRGTYAVCEIFFTSTRDRPR